MNIYQKFEVQLCYETVDICKYIKALLLVLHSVEQNIVSFLFDMLSLKYKFMKRLTNSHSEIISLWYR